VVVCFVCVLRISKRERNRGGMPCRKSVVPRMLPSAALLASRHATASCGCDFCTNRAAEEAAAKAAAKAAEEEEEKIKAVMDKVECRKCTAKRALRHSGGDVSKALELIKTRKTEKSRYTRNNIQGSLDGESDSSCSDDEDCELDWLSRQPKKE